MSQSKDNSRYDRAIEETLLTAEYIHQLKKSRNIISQAQTRAKKIIQATEKSADAAFQQAMTDGYNQGVKASIELLSDYLSSINTTRMHLVTTLKKELSKVLIDIIGSEEIITKELNQWAKLQTDKNINLLIPMSLDIQVDKVRERLQQENKNVNITSHNENTIIAEIGDQIFCIDIARFHEKMISESLFASATVDKSAEEINLSMLGKCNIFLSSQTSGEEYED